VEEAKEMEAKVSTLAKEKAKAEHKLNQLNQKLSKLATELKDERHMNESLRKNQVL
jgi:chromosome segregation ATPase